MPKRFTITEKWEDRWFWSLKPNEKLLWNYLCDKCDLAGFWEVNIELAAVQTKITKRGIEGALKGLSRGYLESGKYLWLRNFIYHQGNYPLNPKNNAHKHIIALISRHCDFDVDFYEELDKTGSPKVGASQSILGANQGLISPIGISKGKGKGKGKGNKGGWGGEIPSYKLKDFLDAGILVGLTVAESEACFDYYKGEQFLFGSGRSVMNAADACKRWRNNRQYFTKQGKQKESVADHVEQLKAEGRL